VIAGYNISPTCVRISVISYSDNAVVSIELNRYGDRNSLQQAVLQLRLLSGGSNLANAFNLLRTRVFVTNVIRQGTGLIAVVVTDQIQQSQQLTNEANSVKGQGITVVGVGITRQGRVDTNTLFGVSTNNYAVTVSDYNQLSGAVSRITTPGSWGCPIDTPPPPPVGGTYCFMCISHITASFTVCVLRHSYDGIQNCNFAQNFDIGLRCAREGDRQAKHCGTFLRGVTKC